MPKYMILYRSSLNAEDQMGTPEQTQEGLKAWMSWAGRVGSALIDMGAPLGESHTTGETGEVGVPISGYSVIEAESPRAVKNLLEGHPHLSAPSGTFIEILEELPIPGM